MGMGGRWWSEHTVGLVVKVWVPSIGVVTRLCGGSHVTDQHRQTCDLTSVCLVACLGGAADHRITPQDV
jgi:hypothetical protein